MSEKREDKPNSPRPKAIAQPPSSPSHLTTFPPNALPSTPLPSPSAPWYSSSESRRTGEVSIIVPAARGAEANTPLPGIVLVRPRGELERGTAWAELRRFSERDAVAPSTTAGSSLLLCPPVLLLVVFSSCSFLLMMLPWLMMTCERESEGQLDWREEMRLLSRTNTHMLLVDSNGD